MARYRMVSTIIWNDRKFRALSDDGQLLFLFVLTHPHMTSLGGMRATLGGLAEEKNWARERVSKGFLEASKLGLIQYDEVAACLVLPNFLKHNPPANPNVVKSWPNVLEMIPECELKNMLIASIHAYMGALDEPFQKAFETVSKGFPDYANQPSHDTFEPFRIQEQEQEQEQERRKKYCEGSPDKPAKPSRDVAVGILEFLNQKTGKNYRAFEGLNGKRKPTANLELILARLGDGKTDEDLRGVIARKVREWKGDAQMAKYLRPATLFNRTKCEQYVGEQEGAST